MADTAFMDGWHKEKPAQGLRAMARVMPVGGFSQAFHRERLDIERLGYSSLEDFLVAFWEGFFLPKDANNLLTMLWTLAARRHQRQRALSRRLQEGASSHQD